MRYYSNKLNTLVTQLTMLPGIGQKTAERLAYHIVKLPKDRIQKLSDAILDASENVTYCKTCFATCDEDECPVCRSQNRNHRVIMVVENDDDMAQIERSEAFNGVYHVLQGALNPMGGIGPEDLRLKELMRRLIDDVDEVILATSSSTEGDMTASYITKLVKPLGITVTRLASGIPIGADLQAVDSATITRAINGRSNA